MAINNNNIIISGASGQIGKQLVVKQYSFGTVISKYPDMSKVIPTKKQLKEKGRFARAVAFAQNIINNPQKKMEWQQKLPEGKKVYHAAIQWFLENEDLASR
ncbi:MAG: hypothetical protein ACOVO1_04635 [Chitinophagaceae bacterium]